jgi:hypothetical protein
MTELVRPRAVKQASRVRIPADSHLENGYFNRLSNLVLLEIQADLKVYFEWRLF